MSQMNILLIEDDQWLAEMYSVVLEQQSGLVVQHASSATSGLDILDSQLMDLVILDLFLPEHNGIELLHELSSFDEASRPPIIILSAVFEHELSLGKRWQQYGVVEYLYKPHTKPDDLVAAVEKHLLALEAAQ